MDSSKTKSVRGAKGARAGLSELQQLTQIYNLISVQFHLDTRAAAARAESSAKEVREWLGAVDEQVSVRHLREFVQKSREVTPATIEVLSRYFIDKAKKSAEDKDKIGMLLTEYICIRDPMLLREESRITHEGVASELEPVVGKTQTTELPMAIQELLALVGAARELSALMSHAVLEQGRKWKHLSSLAYNAAAPLVAVTAYNLRVRAAFYRLLHAELHRIHRMLDQLRGLGVQQVDASAAGMSPDESLATIRELCIAWTQPVRASYAEGQAFVQVVQLKEVLRRELEQAGAGKKVKPPVSPEATAPAAAAEVEEIGPLTAASPERWMNRAVDELESFQPVIRIADADIRISWLEAEIFFSPNPLYKKVLTRLIVLRALIQHATETAGYPVSRCYEFAVQETRRIMTIVDDIHDVVGAVPAGKLAAAVDRVFDAMIALKEKMDSAG